MENYKFEKYWPTDTGIGWWDESRTELNKIITAYNDWQIQDDFEEKASKKVLALIEYSYGHRYFKRRRNYSCFYR